MAKTAFPTRPPPHLSSAGLPPPTLGSPSPHSLPSDFGRGEAGRGREQEAAVPAETRGRGEWPELLLKVTPAPHSGADKAWPRPLCREKRGPTHRVVQQPLAQTPMSVGPMGRLRPQALEDRPPWACAGRGGDSRPLVGEDVGSLGGESMGRMGVRVGTTQPGAAPEPRSECPFMCGAALGKAGASCMAGGNKPSQNQSVPPGLRLQAWAPSGCCAAGKGLLCVAALSGAGL